MPKADTDFKYTCNHCMVAVTEANHRWHLKILNALWHGWNGSDDIGVEDLFVHERGHIQSFDEDGTVVVCDKCFVQELGENLKTEDF